MTPPSNGKSTRPLLIGGCPGSGKTTVARALAERMEHAVRMETDVFFDFIEALADPSTPEAETQNRTVVRAYCRAARAYVDGGYQVCLEGVLGPWFLHLVRAELDAFDYILLHASAATTRERVAHRAGPTPGRPSAVDRMHPQFERLLDEYERHVIDTETLAPEDVVREIVRRREAGSCAIMNSVDGPG